MTLAPAYIGSRENQWQVDSIPVEYDSQIIGGPYDRRIITFSM